MFGFTEAQEMFRREVKSFVDRELLPGIRQRMKQSDYPVELRHKIARQGLLGEYPIEQRLRDVIATEIMEGTHEIQKLIISREAFGAEYRPF